jgi:hypothetical protein
MFCLSFGFISIDSDDAVVVAFVSKEIDIKTTVLKECETVTEHQFLTPVGHYKTATISINKKKEIILGLIVFVNKNNLFLCLCISC